MRKLRQKWEIRELKERISSSTPCEIISFSCRSLSHGSFQRDGQLWGSSLGNIHSDYCRGDCLVEYHLLLWEGADQCKINAENPFLCDCCSLKIMASCYDPGHATRCWTRQTNEQSVAQRHSLKYSTWSKAGSLPLRQTHTDSALMSRCLKSIWDTSWGCTASL